MNKVQVVICKCGSEIAGCWEPDCYIEKDWLKSIRDYANKGYTIKIKKRAKIESCKCNKQD
jgi:hypothetical protein